MVTPDGHASRSHPSDEPDALLGDDGRDGPDGRRHLRSTLALARVETDQVLVDTDRFDDLDSVMPRCVERDDGYRYSVAWVDCIARGARTGRAVLTRARPRAAPTPSRRVCTSGPSRLAVPFSAPGGPREPVDRSGPSTRSGSTAHRATR